MKNNDKRLIVVLGMHRSGTSTITRALNVLGVELGDRLLEPMEGINSKGFFEDIDINELNIEILKVLGSDWDSLTLIEPSDIKRLHELGYFLRAANLLHQKTADVEVFGFKDPRVAKLLPFWHEVFEQCGLDIGYVIVIRNPLSVAQSLAKRDRFSFEKSYLLWLGHVINSLAYAQKYKSVMIDYDCFLSDTETNIEKIADCLNLKINLHKLREYKLDFLDENLRHTIYSINDLMVDEACPPLVQELYSELLNIARATSKIDFSIFQQKLTSWMREFDRLKVNFRLVDQYADQIDDLKRIITNHDCKLFELIQEVIKKDPVVFKKAFDARTYLEINTDVATAGVDAYQHFVSSGVAERRMPAADLYLFIKDSLSEYLQELNVKLNEANLHADEQRNKLVDVEAACSLTVLEAKETYKQSETKLKQEHVEQIQSQHSQIVKNYQQIESYLLRLVEREKVFVAQIVDLQQVHEQQRNEQRNTYVDREQVIARKLEQVQQQYENSLCKSVEREKVFSEQMFEQQKIYEKQKAELIIKYADKEQVILRQWGSAQLQIETNLRELLEQERIFSFQLNELREKNELQIGDLNHAHALSVQDMQALLEQARQQIEGLKQALCEKEKVHVEELQRMREDLEKQQNEDLHAYRERERLTAAQLLSAHRQIEAQMIGQVNREQIFAKQVQETHKKHEKNIVEQNDAHTLREQDIFAQLAQAHQQIDIQKIELKVKETAFIETVQELRREKDHDQLLFADVRQSLENKEVQLRILAEHEKNEIQCIFEQQKIEQENIYIEREKSLNKIIECKSIELHQLIKKHLEVEQALTQDLLNINNKMNDIKTSYSWRWTSPLRRFFYIFRKNIFFKNDIVHPHTLGINMAITLNANKNYLDLINNNGIYDMSLNEAGNAVSSLDELLSYHDEYFIFHAYKVLLERMPDSAGASYYLSRIKSGISKIEILSQLRSSKEGQAYPEKLVGLDAAIRRIRRQRWPVIGSLFLDSAKENEIKIQLINNKLRALDDKLERQYFFLNSALNEIKLDIEKSAVNHSANTMVCNAIEKNESTKEKEVIDDVIDATAEVLISDVSDYDVLQESELFDVNYYLSTYTDVAQENVNALKHYLLDGWQEGRNPSSSFDTKYYLSTNHDVAESGANPLVHYIKYGRDEGRMPSETSATPSVQSVLPFIAQDQCINVFELDIPIDIVIPVYNGFEYLEALFSSIVKNSSMQYRLIVVNDSSPDLRVANFLEELLINYPLIDILLLNNEVNLGFVKSVNKAVGHVNNHFVLLNTDTEVPPQWLERLMYPIFAMDNVASTTPFTNAGTICSFPRYLEDNSIFEGLDVEVLDSYFKNINVNKTMIEIPTGVGFCMGVNKKLVDEIGMFDEVFGKGYGEENDWCQRAVSCGYKNLHIPNLFVFHKHGGSFDSETKKKLIEKNYKILTSRHPSYGNQVQLTIQENKLDLVRRLVELRVVSNTRSSHLIIDHNLGGGANHYSDEKNAEYLLDGGFICTVKFDFTQTKQYLIEFKYDDVAVLFKSDEIKDLYTFLAEFNFNEIFINSLVSFEEVAHHLNEIMLLKLRLGVATKLIVPIHDFFPVCTNYTLLDETVTYCGVPTDLDKCVNCLKKNTGEFKSFEASIDIHGWRADWGRLLNLADEVLCFSESSKEIFLKAYPEQYEKVIVTPHDISGRHPVIFVPRKKPSELRVGVLGGINEAKGANIIRQLVNYFDESDIPAKVILIGEISIPFTSPSFEKTGRYNKNELEKIVLDKEIDVFLIPSIWPETYSYTTDEIMQMGYPLIVFNYGAPAERVCHYKNGKVIDINKLNETLVIYADMLEVKSSRHKNYREIINLELAIS